MDDRRRHRRYVLQATISVLAGSRRTALPGRLLDLSQGGAFVTCCFEAEVGTGAYVQFVDQQQRECEATGHVVRTLPFGTETGIAIEFAFANDEFVTFLQTYADVPEALRPGLVAGLRNFRLCLP